MKPYSPDFEQAWANRIRRPNESKVDASRAWESCRKAKELPEPGDFFVAQEAYKAYVDRTKTEARFVQHFATFVNKRSFVYWLEQDRESQKAAVQNATKTQVNSAVPAIMAPVFKALGDERYLSQFSTCQFEEEGDLLVIRPRYRFMVDRIQEGLVARLTGRRVKVEVAA